MNLQKDTSETLPSNLTLENSENPTCDVCLETSETLTSNLTLRNIET